MHSKCTIDLEAVLHISIIKNVITKVYVGLSWKTSIFIRLWALLERFAQIVHICSNLPAEFLPQFADLLKSAGRIPPPHFADFLKSGSRIPPIVGKFFEFISGVRIKSCGMDPPKFWHLVEIFQIILLHVLSNEACKFAINLFPISWGPFENVTLLYFLLKMQIWNGCNVLNIAGNPIKNITVIFHFWVQDQQLWNELPNMWWNLVNSTFAWTVQSCMQICHKPFFPLADNHFKMLIYYIFY